MKVSAPTWLTLKVIGNSYPAKFSIMIPFLGYLILFQKDFVRFMSGWSLIGEHIVSSDASFPVGLNFYFLYFGLFIFGLGSFTFSVFCEPVIKRHFDADAFVAYTATTTTVEDIRYYCGYIIEHTSEVSPEAKKAKLILHSLSSGIQSNIPNDSRVLVQKIYYDMKNRSFFGIRIIAALAFVFGIILLTIPSVLVFVRISRLFWSQLF